MLKLKTVVLAFIVLAFIGLYLILFFINYNHDNNIFNNYYDNDINNKLKDKINNFSVLYLIQSASFFNLPDWYSLFYDNSSNDAMILLLYDENNYKKEITNIIKIKSLYNYNLKIIYNFTSTFWSGRNLLLFNGIQYQLKLKKKFNYFAFLDEDLILYQLNNYQRDKTKLVKTRNESKILLYKYFYNDFLQKYERILSIGIPNRIKIRNTNSFNYTIKFIISNSFDTMAWFINTNIIKNKYLFPFNDKCDSINWYYGSYLIKTKFKILLPTNSQIRYTPFFIGNTKHSKYTKKDSIKDLKKCIINDPFYNKLINECNLNKLKIVDFVINKDKNITIIPLKELSNNNYYYYDDIGLSNLCEILPTQ